MIPTAPFSMRFNDYMTLANVDILLGLLVILCKPQRSNGPNLQGLEEEVQFTIYDSLDSEVVGFVKYEMKKEIKNKIKQEQIRRKDQNLRALFPNCEVQLSVTSPVPTSWRQGLNETAE